MENLPDNSIENPFQKIERLAKVAFSSEAKESSEYNKKITDISVKRKQSELDFQQQILSFRKSIFIFLLFFMTVETIVLFLIIILASLPSKPLLIEDTTLQVLVGATIAQISTMMIVVIKSVYSDSLNKQIMPDK